MSAVEVDNSPGQGQSESGAGRARGVEWREYLFQVVRMDAASGVGYPDSDLGGIAINDYLHRAPGATVSMDCVFDEIRYCLF